MSWHLKDRDLKRYPHFDAIISAAAAVDYATNPNLVAKHQFYPFIRFVQRWTRFAPKGESGKSKQRELRYAARRDAYIFSYYRSLLSKQYEALLSEYGLADKVLAYRRILDEGGIGGKCNIHFARDAFIKIRQLGTCCAIALDISQYFESLDHEQLKQLWCRLLKVKRLSSDHFAVFKAITQYSVVDKEKVYERLGHYGPKRITANGKVISGYLTRFNEIPKQLCSGKEFREKIAPKGNSIIEKNYKPYGIPQGAPISDLLANLYLLDFDVEVVRMTEDLGGYYYRYSDDILILIPGSVSQALSVEASVRELIKGYGKKLQIKEEKSSIVSYYPGKDGQVCDLILGDDSCKQGIEYLGFRYNGKFAYIRNRTLQNLYRKITRSARREANAIARRYPDKSAAKLKSQFNRSGFVQRFGRVESFYEKSQEYRSWTFWTYVSRAASVFGSLGSPIPRQLRRLRSIINHKIDAEIERAVALRDSPNRRRAKLLQQKKK